MIARCLYLLLGLLLIPLITNAAPPLRTVEGTVITVADGDTLTIEDSNGEEIKVHLYGIDAPEIAKRDKRTGQESRPGQPYGDEARQILRKKLQRKQVTVDIMDSGRNGRVSAVVWSRDRNINAELVREGAAWADRQNLDRFEATLYLSAEEQAQKERTGLWQFDNPQPPWEFRKLHADKPMQSRHPERSHKPAKMITCRDARCGFFNQTVPADHQHSFRCADARCGSFNQYVSSGHKHSYRCNDARCKEFNQFVPAGHQHSR